MSSFQNISRKRNYLAMWTNLLKISLKDEREVAMILLMSFIDLHYLLLFQFFALILGLVYLKTNDDYEQKDIMNINGVIFIIITNLSFYHVFSVLNVRTRSDTPFVSFLTNLSNFSYSQCLIFCVRVLYLVYQSSVIFFEKIQVRSF